MPAIRTPVVSDAYQALWIEAPGRAVLRAGTLGARADDHVRVRALHSAVSRGTELLVFRGEVPPSEFARMRAPFQQGEFPGPVKYGYASVGLVEAGPPALQGRAVFCLHPHQSRYDVPAAAVHPLPEGLPAARAVLAANMETAVNALWDAAPRLGDRVAVVGGGVVGLLVAWLASRIPGCAVQLVDVRAERAAVAAHLGLDFALPDAAMRNADLVVHASGQPAGLASALGLAGFEATVLELSWYGQRAVTLPLGEAFHAQRLTLRSSQVGQVATAQRGRWSHGRRMGLALALLAQPAAAVLDALITDSAPLQELPAVLARLAAGAPDTLCQRIDYS
ncbi:MULTISPECIES: zinc-binding alcohol dehydrogenase [unclassified Variovorax]|uniref:zinc-dependent alcohol dehydrogenase n=1 Tax=unclassified Variovorax TaxID=663243 RepID=UPI002578D697|nr:MULTISPECIES: zinc-binding alcohol dehydrogenase [unclassified Variovorax]MDM0087569.1 zinc-binding alcohol dehydrogenase [Variovorax sp. J22G40]MDM0144174.1 zinc-binding alcohol dehydrogenase [Variovorax sp. J2P1-31]